jgi:DeoR family transcriptional regulator, fructose operon transcriptional repressor
MLSFFVKKCYKNGNLCEYFETMKHKMPKTKKKLIPIERRQQIIDHIAPKKVATISEISKVFNISEMTIRRDLLIMTEEGLLEKVYGGVIVSKRNKEPLVNQRISENILAKQKIAGEAIKRISDNDIVFIESGTTCLELVKLLNSKKNLTIITAAPHILFELSNQKNNNGFNGEVMCCGGYLRGDPDDLFIGERAIEFFNNLRINVAFFGILGINIADGFMVSNTFEAALLKKVMSVSNKSIGLADSSKFNKFSFIKVGPVEIFDEIITDTTFLDQDTINDFKNIIELSLVDL